MHTLSGPQHRELLQTPLHEPPPAIPAAAAGPHLLDLPSGILAHVLLTATSHVDPLAHVAICSQVHPELRRVTMGSPLYASQHLHDLRYRAQLLWKLRFATSERRCGRYSTLTALADVEYAYRDSGDIWDSDWVDTPPPGTGDPLERVLESVHLGDGGAQAFGTLLQTLPKGAHAGFAELALSDCGVTGAGFSSIAKGLVHLREASSITFLVLSNNALGDAACSTLASGLPPHLRYLWLINVGCGDQGLVALLAQLVLCTAIRTIDVGDNPAIGDPGLTALATALPQMHSLHTLQVGGCRIERAGVLQLAHALPMSGLESLSLGRSPEHEWSQFHPMLDKAVEQLKARTGVHLQLYYEPVYTATSIIDDEGYEEEVLDDDWSDFDE